MIGPAFDKDPILLRQGILGAAPFGNRYTGQEQRGAGEVDDEDLAREILSVCRDRACKTIAAAG